MHDDVSIPRMPRKQIELGILHQLPATSGHIKSKQQTFTLSFLRLPFQEKEYQFQAAHFNIISQALKSTILSCLGIPIFFSNTPHD